MLAIQHELPSIARLFGKQFTSVQCSQRHLGLSKRSIIPGFQRMISNATIATSVERPQDRVQKIDSDNFDQGGWPADSDELPLDYVYSGRVRQKELRLHRAQTDQQTQSSTRELYTFWVGYHRSEVAAYRSAEDLFKLHAQTNVLSRTLDVTPPDVRRKFWRSIEMIRTQNVMLVRELYDLVVIRAQLSHARIVPLFVRAQLWKMTIKREKKKGDAEKRRQRRKKAHQERRTPRSDQASPVDSTIENVTNTWFQSTGTKTPINTASAIVTVFAKEQPELWAIETLATAIKRTKVPGSIRTILKPLSRIARLFGKLKAIDASLFAYDSNLQLMLQLASDLRVLQYYKLGKYPGSISIGEVEAGKRLVKLVDNYFDKVRNNKLAERNV
jgi:hypothetical protein